MLDNEDGKLPPESETDKLQNVLDAEDPAMSALNDLVGRSDFDDMTDDEIIAFFKQYGITGDMIDELMDDVTAIQNADTENPNLGAQGMANEDKTDVKVTEEDKDSDGDTDKITAEKQEPEDDSDAGYDAIVEALNSEPKEEAEETENSEPEGDKPHDSEPENRTNSIAKTLGSYRW